jgi:hypothetical protein
MHQETSQQTQWYWQPIKNLWIRRVMTKPADIAKRLKDGRMGGIMIGIRVIIQDSDSKTNFILVIYFVILLFIYESRF